MGHHFSAAFGFQDLGGKGEGREAGSGPSREALPTPSQSEGPGSRGLGWEQGAKAKGDFQGLC